MTMIERTRKLWFFAFGQGVPLKGERTVKPAPKNPVRSRREITSHPGLPDHDWHLIRRELLAMGAVEVESQTYAL